MNDSVRTTIGLVVLVVTAASARAQQPTPRTVLTFRTGAAEVPEPVMTVLPLPEQRYRVFVDQAKTDPHSVPVSRIPPAVSRPLYGYNFVVGEKNRGWVLDGDDARGWRLYLDWKGDGDLSRTEARTFKRVGRTWRLQVEVHDGATRWPCVFEIRRVDVDGTEKLAVVIGDATVRRGVVAIDGKRAPFAVRGVQGRYNTGDYSIQVDRGTGEIERYKRSEGYVNLFGRSYAFAVDASGDTLTLEALPEVQPERPSLRSGSVAPEFSATDIDGGSHSVARYRGRLLLLEFWSTSCAPCRAEAPQMVQFFNGAAHAKVAFLGVASDSSETTLRAFVKDLGISWPQVREPFEGRLHKQFRVNGEPTYFLVGPTGEILDDWVGGGLAVERVAKFLQAR
jgi:peroxiredoxin